MSPTAALIIRASTTDDEIDAALPYLDMRKEAKERRDDAAAVIEEQGDQVVLELHDIGGVDVLWSEAFGYALVNERTGGIGDSRLLTAADDDCRSPEDAARIWRTGAADLFPILDGIASSDFAEATLADPEQIEAYAEKGMSRTISREQAELICRVGRAWLRERDLGNGEWSRMREEARRALEEGLEYEGKLFAERCAG